MKPSWTSDAPDGATLEREAVSTPRSGPATITAVLSKQRVRVTWPDGAADEASLAVPDYAPRVDDRALVFTDGSGARWIIGVMNAPRPSSLLEEALESPPVTRVEDKRGRLLFEYDPETDRAVLHAAVGDLELSVPAGALRIEARDGVTVETPADVRIRAERELEITSEKAGRSSRLRLQPGEMSVTSAVVTAAATRAEVLAEKVGVSARHLESHVERARYVAQVVDVRAGRIVERAVDVYREVERLSQTRAGRLKLVARKAAQLVGENTLVKARDRMKVKGERIHLA